MKFESKTSPGKFYEVDVQAGTCTCPHYQNRMKYVKGKCKHLIQALDEQLKMGENENLLLQLIQKEKEVDVIEIENKYGEEAINILLKRGEVYEEHGRIRIL